ncbi:MAG: NAD(P)H-dependent oxidoreductase subunit E [Ghiorsea sp.]
MTETSEKLSISSYKRHAVMCTGKSCGENLPLLKYLKTSVDKAGLSDGKDAVRVNRAGCLGICKQGPIMVVHPEGVWYANLTEDKIDTIVDSHFAQNKPVSEWLFHENSK